jgi:hypothetical protein
VEVTLSASVAGSSGVTSPASSQFDLVSAEAIRRHQPVRLRINLELYDPASTRYRFWKGTGLRLDLDTRQAPQLGDHFRQSLQWLVDALGTAGPQQTMEALAALVAEARQRQGDGQGVQQHPGEEAEEPEEPADV